MSGGGRRWKVSKQVMGRSEGNWRRFLIFHFSLSIITIFPTNSARYFSERLINSQAVFKIRLTGDGKISWLKSKSAEISEAL